MSQRKYAEATETLLKCLQYFEVWLGTMHDMVADISHCLGVAHSADRDPSTQLVFHSLSPCLCYEWCLIVNAMIPSDEELAEKYLRKALSIRHEREASSLACAETLYQLASLTQRSTCKLRKNEAVERLHSCLDIRVQHLGEYNILVNITTASTG